jgi:hypothetical protein
MDIRRLLDKVCIYWHPTGSRFTCDPPVMNTDEDYVCLMVDSGVLETLGFHCTTGENDNYDISEFTTWRYGRFNLVVTDSMKFYEKFVEATNEAKAKNILDKGERIKLFQMVLYGNEPALEDLPW